MGKMGRTGFIPHNLWSLQSTQQWRCSYMAGGKGRGYANEVLGTFSLLAPLNLQLVFLFRLYCGLIYGHCSSTEIISHLICQLPTSSWTSLIINLVSYSLVYYKGFLHISVTLWWIHYYYLPIISWHLKDKKNHKKHNHQDNNQQIHW